MHMVRLLVDQSHVAQQTKFENLAHCK